MNDLVEMDRFLKRLGGVFSEVRRFRYIMRRQVKTMNELELLYQSYIVRILPQFEHICCLKDECKYIKKRILAFYR